MIRVLCICVCLACAAGCAKGRGASAGTQPSSHHRASAHATTKAVTPAELRSLAMNAADAYATAIEQACDQVRTSTTKPAIVDWSWQTKINTNLAAFTNASSPNDAEALLDMVLYASLKRHAMEDYWIPTLLHDEGKPALRLYKSAEADVWNIAAKALTPEQLDEMRVLIDRWRKEHPGQYYVVHVRLANVAGDLGVDAHSPKGHAPGSFFSLLHVDPLAGLNPATAEVRNYRSMSERMMYMSVRMPRTIGWQAEYAALRATATPEVHQMLDSVDRFATIAEKLPEQLFQERQKALLQAQELIKVEREAAINQIDQRLAAQRKAFADEMIEETKVAREVIDSCTVLIKTTEKAGISIGDSTTAAILKAEQASRRTMMLGFVLGLVLLTVPFAALLLYRLAVKRWVTPAARDSSIAPK